MAKGKTSKKTNTKGNLIVRAGKAMMGRPKTALLVGVLIIVLCVGLVPKVKQSFATGCSGSKIDVYSIRRKSDGAYAGYVELYWTGSKNCAIAYAGGITSGDKIWREVCIRAGSQSVHCDDGYYTSYAGPVYTGLSAGKCIDIWAGDYKNYNSSLSGTPIGAVVKYNVHCG